jgi:hypothetical protein
MSMSFCPLTPLLEISPEEIIPNAEKVLCIDVPHRTTYIISRNPSMRHNRQ